MVNWNEKAKEFGDSEYGAHSDKYLVMLENEFIEKQLKRIKPTNILILVAEMDKEQNDGVSMQVTKLWE